MLETFKKQANKSCILRIIGALVVVAGICIFFNTSLFYLVTGPKDLSKESYNDLEALEGKYVSYDVKCALFQFAEHTTVYEDTGKETVNGGNYIVYDEEKNIFFGVYLSKTQVDKIDELIEESWSWLYEEIDEVSFTIPVKGTWTLMTGKLLGYFNSDINEYIGSDFTEMATAYYIDTDSMGSHSKTTIYIVAAILVIAVLVIIYTLIRMLSGKYDKNIKKYLANNPSVSITTIERDYTAAHAFKTKWIGQKWTIYMKGMYACILSNKDIIWAYYYQRTGKNAVSEIRTFTSAKKQVSISMSEADAMDVLKFYGEEQPHMVIGYTKELEAMYNKNMNEFLNIKYNPYMEEQKNNNDIFYQEEIQSSSVSEDPFNI